MLTIVEFAACFMLYYAGYLMYCQERIGMTVLCAAGAAVCFLSFLGRLLQGRYRNMPMHKIDKLSGRAFEQYLTVHFRRLGYRVSTTDSSYDYGADLVLKKRGEVIVVQAKRYDRNIGIAAVQEAVGAVAYYNADRAMVVTNRYFTKSAVNLARQNDVELWNREDIRHKFHIKE